MPLIFLLLSQESMAGDAADFPSLRIVIQFPKRRFPVWLFSNKKNLPRPSRMASIYISSSGTFLCGNSVNPYGFSYVGPFANLMDESIENIKNIGELVHNAILSSQTETNEENLKKTT
jgi:hypothetical protein